MKTHFTVDPNDWGFDNIWPAAPKAQDQVWFRDWEHRIRREGMSSLSREIEDDAHGMYLQMRKDINRQIYGVDK